MSKNMGNRVVKPKGWWADHKLNRRSVKEDALKFVGFEQLMKMIMSIGGAEAEKYRALFATIFCTGGRISEVLELTKENFSLQNNYIIVKGMKLEKHYKKRGEYLERWNGVGDPPNTSVGLLYKWDDIRGGWYRRRYKTVKEEAYRKPFAIPLNEPPARIMWDYIQKHPGGKLFNLSRVTVYLKFKKLGIWLHWIRAQRASCLRSYYKFPIEDVKDWFGWENLKTTLTYAHIGEEDQIAGFERVNKYPGEALDLAEKMLRREI